jgi:hypothetical protein
VSSSSLRAAAYPAHRDERIDPHFKSQNLLPPVPGGVHAEEEVPRHRWSLLRVLLRQHPAHGKWIMISGLPRSDPQGHRGKVRAQGVWFQDLRP